MLDKLFLSILNMSITASFVIFGVLLVRLGLKKAPKIFSYALWAIVLFRLICPFSFESTIGLLPINTTPIPQDIVYSTDPQINTGLKIFDSMVNPILPAPNQIENSVNPLQIWIFVGSLIWVIGIVTMLIYSVIQFVRLKQKLIGATPLRDHIYLADHISAPFVMGFMNPKIYLPSAMSGCEQNFIILHEQYHIKRLDHIMRVLSFIALTFHWFNPLVWLAFILSGKDMEMSCDEAVMNKMDTDIRVEYSQSLLYFATGKKLIAATPLAFGESDTKDRVKNVMKYKKPMLWVPIISVIAVVIVGAGLMANPIDSSIPNPSVQEYLPGQGNIRGNVDVEGFEKISPDFAIGADKYGVAVFKNPHKAFETLEQLYADGIAYIRQANDLPSLSKHNYNLYKKYGSQMTDGTSEQVTQAGFVSRFLDIYENSFSTQPPNTDYVEPTVEADSKSNALQKLTHDQAVALALFSLSGRNLQGECISEGHIILGYDDSDEKKTIIYALTEIGWYGFENNNFTFISGSAFPAVITLNNDNTTQIETPLDGSDYATSIQKMFPKEYHDRIFKYQDIDHESFKQQREIYASEYLSKIGRNATIGDYSDFKYTSLTHEGVSVEVSNKLEDFYKAHNNYPSFIGTREKLENDVRMVYEMSYQKNQDEIKFTKYDYETRTTIEEYTVDAKTGVIAN